ncbi:MULTISPECIES: peroxiredoxin [unclassified Blastococcus]|uniref:peroxiredoxin family protein n=1 Tax=unclassified Blastococcus TaxID=2619396 RepID=UPI001EEF9A63|nr:MULTISPECIES: peroxiredoxin family protein [unclassified Blastococcus]
MAILVIGGLYALYQSSTSSAGAADPERYDVGSPGPGEEAPDFTLPGTDGQDVSLSDFRGENVLLYFHEGLGCQACWDQIRDLEAATPQLEEAGVDRLVSITNAPQDLLVQKMDDDGLESLALADPDLAAIEAYKANKYGMMGDTTAGHSFILVDGEGEIVWRADYGGAPDYTMYLPVETILADLEAARTDR